MAIGHRCKTVLYYGLEHIIIFQEQREDWFLVNSKPLSDWMLEELKILTESKPHSRMQTL